MTDLKKLSIDKLRPYGLCDPGCHGRCKICPSTAWDELERRHSALELELAAKDAECEELRAQMDQYPPT